MSSKRKDTRRIHRRSMSVTALAALAVLAVATPATATTPPGSDETTTTAAAETTTTEAATSSTAAATSTSAAAATTTAAPAPTSNFATVLAEQCEGDTGQQLLASGLQVVMGTDGSLRIVEVLLTCDVEFVGAVDPELGRPPDQRRSDHRRPGEPDHTQPGPDRLAQRGAGDLLAGHRRVGPVPSRSVASTKG